MKLKGSAASHLGKDVIIVSDVFKNDNQFVVIVMDKLGKLSEAFIRHIVVDYGIETTHLFKQDEWSPDWEEISYGIFKNGC